MKKTLKAQTILDASKMFGSIKLIKLEDAEYMPTIKKMQAVKEAAKPIQALIDAATKALEPEDYQELLKKGDMFDTLSDDEKQLVSVRLQAIYNRRTRATAEELMKDVKIDITPISDETLERIIKSNDFTVAEILTLQDVLCK